MLNGLNNGDNGVQMEVFGRGEPRSEGSERADGFGDLRKGSKGEDIGGIPMGADTISSLHALPNTPV